ncbi:MAG TPA: hypothetical protein PKK26_02435 [Candidatus Wallbacteria bacterium]|nr:hypothetical protein [Candidatus Wallbacteria bacterium]
MKKGIFSSKPLKIFVIFVLLMMSAGMNSGCDNIVDAFMMKKYKAKSEKKAEAAQKKADMLELDKLKPKFMFEDDEKYFKSYMTLKEEFFFMERSSYVGSAATNNFFIDEGGNFLTYDKANGVVLVFNKFGMLSERIKLNFGSESRILAPTNMLRDVSGNIIMACSVLGRFYRFARTGAMLNSNDITADEETGFFKLNFATKMFENSEYRIYVDIHSRRVYFYQGVKKAFEFSYDQISDEAYIYFSPDNGIYLVDPPNSAIISVIPLIDPETKTPYKCDLKKYSGNKILKASDGTVYIFKKSSRIIEKYNSRGELTYQYGISGVGNITYNNNICPVDFAVDAEDNLYILDDKNFKVNVYNKTGVFSFSFGSFGRRSGRFQSPSRIVVDRLKRIIVTDSERNEAMVFSANGEYFEAYGDVLGTNALVHYGIYADMHEKIHILDFTGNQHYSVPYEFQFLKILNEMLAAKTNFPHNFITIDRLANFNFFDFNGQKNIELTPLSHMRALRVPEEINSRKVEPKKLFVKNISDDGQGNVLAIAKDQPYVYKLNVAGRILKKYKMPKNGQAYSAIASDMFRNFYLLDAAEKRILKFDEEARYKNSFSAAPGVSPPIKNINALNFSKKNLAFATDFETRRALVFSTLNDFSFDSAGSFEEPNGRDVKILDVATFDDNFYAMCSSGGNLMLLKYKIVSYYRDGVQLFSQGLYQEALVAFEKYARGGFSNPNALYYMAQCHRKLGNSYEAAVIETELSKKYPSSMAAKKVN